MSIRHLLGLDPAPPPTSATPAAPVETESATIRRIGHELEQLEPDRRRYLAGFAYILGRVANADLTITDEETALMEHTVREIGGLPEAQAALVVQIAKNQTELFGGTEDYLVTREFAQKATEEQKHAAIAAAFAVVATDDAINAEESHELAEVAEELGLTRAELNELRRKYADKTTAVQAMRAKQ